MFRFLQFLESRFQGWLLFGVGLTLVAHFLLASFMPSFAQESDVTVYTGRTPEVLMEEFLAEASDEIEVEILVLSEAGDYAISTYRWGETGGFVVMQKKEDGQWQSICGDGGAISGGQDLVNLCGVPLIDAQALWEQLQEDRGAAGYE